MGECRVPHAVARPALLKSCTQTSSPITGSRGLSLHCDTSQGRTVRAACLLLHKKSASLRQDGAVQNAPVIGQKLLQSFVSTISFMYRYTHTSACSPGPCPRATARTPRPFTPGCGQGLILPVSQLWKLLAQHIGVVEPRTSCRAPAPSTCSKYQTAQGCTARWHLKT